MDNDRSHAHPIDLAGRRVVITGATAGLGRALLDELTARGATVGFIARRRESVEATERAVPGSVGVVADVSRQDDIHPATLQLTGRLGGVDVLVHNASSLGPVPLRPLADTECEQFSLALETNVLGPFRLTRALLGSLASSARERGSAAVVTISSDAAVNAYATWGAYGASKAALLHMTRIWDEELARTHVRVVSFDPGDLDTELHALAIPDADRASLRRPADAARELAELIATTLRGGGR